MSDPPSPEPPDLPPNPFGPEGPTPWEDPARALPGRLWGTLALALRPLASLNQVSRGEIGPAARFALWTAIPLALASGVIPFTRTLEFGANFAVKPRSGSSLSLEADVAQAAALGLGLALVQVLAFAMPFASLARAFAADSGAVLSPVGTPLPNAFRCAWRICLYRAWTLPFGFLMIFLLGWSVGGAGGELIGIAARMLIVLQFSAATRLMGAGPFAGLATSIVPLILEAVLTGLLVPQLMPTMEPPAPPPQ